MDHFTDSQKAHFTSWLIDQRKQGVESPSISRFKAKMRLRDYKPLAIYERADRLLIFLAKQSQAIGQQIKIALPEDLELIGSRRYDTLDGVPESVCNLWRAMAWSESTKISEVAFLVDYLSENGWLKRLGRPHQELVRVTVEGYMHIEESRAGTGRTQAFVAMWFADEMEDAFEQGIQPAIEDAGYTAMRIDLKSHINKIDDEIVAEIRRSKFLVADYTQNEQGARGGVYWEDGFASGLGLKVIRTCRKDCIDNLAFDTRQYYHISWETPEELRTELEISIRANIDEDTTPSIPFHHPQSANRA